MTFKVYDAQTLNMVKKINVNTLEELIDFQEEVGFPIIIGQGADGEEEITIYNDWME